MELYKKGFSKKEIADFLGVNVTTVYRYFSNPSRKEKEDFYKNSAYGVYYTKNGGKVLFNRKYQPLRDKTEWVKDIIKTEWFYNDSSIWEERFYNSLNQKSIYEK